MEPIMINITKDNGETLSLTLSDAEKVERAVKQHYCKQDLIDYFENSDKYSDEVLNDESVMKTLLDSYLIYRINADGGEEEECMHWSECLSKAIEYDAAILEKYLLTERVE